MITLGEEYNQRHIDLEVSEKNVTEYGNKWVKGQYFKIYHMDIDWYYTFMYVGGNDWKVVYLTM